jgi:hypothetical protein
MTRCLDDTKLTQLQCLWENNTTHTKTTTLQRQTKQNKTETRLTLSIPFNTDTTHIGQIRQKHWHLIESDPTLKILLPNIPMVAYKRNKNIKEMLVRRYSIEYCRSCSLR